MTDSVYWIWFQFMFGIGTRRSHALMEYFSHPGDIYDGIKNNGHALGMMRINELEGCESAMERAVLLKARTLKKGCDIITPDHADYPPLLHDIYAKPAALYVKGDLSCLRDTLVIGMVGTREFTEYGMCSARELADGLARCGAVVVSGLARGIDSHCHEAALEAGGSSVGILGCGLDIDYPKGSARLKGNMCENGAVVSEYPLGTPPTKTNFPMRNRLISGMSDGVVVVEASLSSGSIITANHALEQNRELFAVPGTIYSAASRGSNKLIKEGARLVENVGDILEEYSFRTYKKLKKHVNHSAENGKAEKSVKSVKEVVRPVAEPEPPAPSPTERKPIPEGCGEHAALVYALISEEPVSVESVAQNCDMDVSRIQSALTELEIYGLIKGYPGRRYSL